MKKNAAPRALCTDQTSWLKGKGYKRSATAGITDRGVAIAGNVLRAASQLRGILPFGE